MLGLSREKPRCKDRCQVGCEDTKLELTRQITPSYSRHGIDLHWMLLYGLSPPKRVQNNGVAVVILWEEGSPSIRCVAVFSWEWTLLINTKPAESS